MADLRRVAYSATNVERLIISFYAGDEQSAESRMWCDGREYLSMTVGVEFIFTNCFIVNGSELKPCPAENWRL